MISCTNGLLDLSDAQAVQPHTPALFNVVSVPFDYDRGRPGAARVAGVPGIGVG